MTSRIIDQVRLNRYVLLCGTVALVVLGFSYFVQYSLNKEPCNLCSLQRIPYFVVLALCLVMISFINSKIAVWGLRILRLCWLVSILIGTYHMLVIWGVVTDPCAVPTNIQTVQDFEMMLHSPPPCSTNAWKVLGIPAPGYNTAFAALLIVFSCFTYASRTSSRNAIL